MPVFKLLGGLLAIYLVYALLRGEVFVKSRWWGKTLRRDESPAAFWSAIALYGLLALALLTVF